MEDTPGTVCEDAELRSNAGTALLATVASILLCLIAIGWRDYQIEKQQALVAVLAPMTTDERKLYASQLLVTESFVLHTEFKTSVQKVQATGEIEDLIDQPTGLAIFWILLIPIIIMWPLLNMLNFGINRRQYETLLVEDLPWRKLWPFGFVLLMWPGIPFFIASAIRAGWRRARA